MKGWGYCKGYWFATRRLSDVYIWSLYPKWMLHLFHRGLVHDICSHLKAKMKASGLQTKLKAIAHGIFKINWNLWLYNIKCGSLCSYLILHLENVSHFTDQCCTLCWNLSMLSGKCITFYWWMLHSILKFQHIVVNYIVVKQSLRWYNWSHQYTFKYGASVHPEGNSLISASFEEIKDFWHTLYNGSLWENLFSIINI